MGQKVNPIGYRLALTRDWRSRWYANPKEYPDFLHKDLEIRQYVKKKLQSAAVAKIVIERAWNSLRVTIFTARPGIVIGRKGAEIEKMTEDITTHERRQVRQDRHPGDQDPGTRSPTRRREHRPPVGAPDLLPPRDEEGRATTMDFGAQGIKLRVAGRLNGAEISRAELTRDGKTPLHTLRAHIDYGFHEANTLYGKIGVKCWICKRELAAEATANAEGAADRRPRPRPVAATVAPRDGGGDRGRAARAPHRAPHPR